MVGPSGSGKSSAWRTLLKALENLEGVEGVAHVVDPKVLKVALPNRLYSYSWYWKAALILLRNLKSTSKKFNSTITWKLFLMYPSG